MTKDDLKEAVKKYMAAYGPGYSTTDSAAYDNLVEALKAPLAAPELEGEGTHITAEYGWRDHRGILHHIKTQEEVCPSFGVVNAPSATAPSPSSVEMADKIIEEVCNELGISITEEPWAIIEEKAASLIDGIRKQVPSAEPKRTKLMYVDGMPRRIQVKHWQPIEKQIDDALGAVEALGADVLLTWAVVYLGRAKDMVADWLEQEAEKTANGFMVEKE